MVVRALFEVKEESYRRFRLVIPHSIDYFPSVSVLASRCCVHIICIF